MNSGHGGWGAFLRGLMTGGISALILIGAGIYVLNQLGVVAISVARVPSVQRFLYWTYANLGLSLIPFTLMLGVFIHSLRRLDRLLENSESTPEDIAQTERWVDIAVSLFFGIGVIWTAIGMRSALLLALEGLDPTTAARLGSFEILRRLVDGGILLALSTTIVGGVGGYLMRLVKTAMVGSRLQAFRGRTTRGPADALDHRLQHIEAQLTELTTRDPGSTRSRELPD